MSDALALKHLELELKQIELEILLTKAVASGSLGEDLESLKQEHKGTALEIQLIKLQTAEIVSDTEIIRLETRKITVETEILKLETAIIQKRTRLMPYRIGLYLLGATVVILLWYALLFK